MDAGLFVGLVLLDEVERDVTQDGEVLRAVAPADAAVVLVEGLSSTQ